MRVATKHRRSFSIVETVVALGILALVMLAMIAADVSGSQLRQTSRQSEWINTQVQDHFEDLRQQEDVGSVRNLVNGGDWLPLGPATTASFRGSGGNSIPNGIVITAAQQRIMTEEECANTFGGSFDLDRDGTPNSDTSVPANYATVIPVQLTVTWTNSLVGPGATRTLTFNTIVYPAGSIAP